MSKAVNYIFFLCLLNGSMRNQLSSPDLFDLASIRCSRQRTTAREKFGGLFCSSVVKATPFLSMYWVWLLRLVDASLGALSKVSEQIWLLLCRFVA